jgi:Ca-activated chloride channel homolog
MEFRLNRCCLSAAAVVVLALGARALPQQGQQPPAAPAQTAPASQADVPIYRVETRLINVPVNVTDAHGVAISDLQQSDFAIREDGKLQKIALFERESATPLSIVMAVDTSGSVLSQMKTEKEAAKQFARDLLREQDEMGLIAFSDESE